MLADNVLFGALAALLGSITGRLFRQRNDDVPGDLVTRAFPPGAVNAIFTFAIGSGVLCGIVCFVMERFMGMFGLIWYLTMLVAGAGFAIGQMPVKGGNKNV